MKQITYLLGVIVTFIFIFIWNPFKSLEERKAEIANIRRVMDRDKFIFYAIGCFVISSVAIIWFGLSINGK